MGSLAPLPPEPLPGLPPIDRQALHKEWGEAPPVAQTCWVKNYYGLPASRGLLVVYLWFTCGFLVVYLWVYLAPPGLLVVYLWFTCGLLVVYLAPPGGLPASRGARVAYHGLTARNAPALPRNAPALPRNAPALPRNAPALPRPYRGLTANFVGSLWGHWVLPLAPSTPRSNWLFTRPSLWSSCGCTALQRS